MDYRDYFNKNKVSTKNTKEKIALTIANLLLKVRLEEGKSQAELARLMKMQQPAIARAEKGTVLPTIEYLQKVASALGKELIIKITGKKTNVDNQTYLVKEAIPSPLYYFVGSTHVVGSTNKSILRKDKETKTTSVEL